MGGLKPLKESPLKQSSLASLQAGEFLGGRDFRQAMLCGKRLET